jgi:hypothetical protein
MQRLRHEAVHSLEALQKLSSALEQSLLHYTDSAGVQSTRGEVLFFTESGECFDRQAVVEVTATQQYRGARMGTVQLKTLLPEKIV